MHVWVEHQPGHFAKECPNMPDPGPSSSSKSSAAKGFGKTGKSPKGGGKGKGKPKGKGKGKGGISEDSIGADSYNETTVFASLESQQEDVRPSSSRPLSSSAYCCFGCLLVVLLGRGY